MQLFPLLLIAPSVLAQSSASSSTATAPRSSTSSSASASASLSTSPVVTATPTQSVSSTQTIGGEGALPPRQTWCPSSIFCAGPLLQALNLAMPYADSKTIVDKPTTKSSQAVLADFNALVASVGGLANISHLEVGPVVKFLENDFRGEGLELEPDTIPQFIQSPTFLKNISDPVVRGFAQTVHQVWPSLIRQTNRSALCSEGNSTGCESSLIPLNHTFVVPGGRFREQYYWDSYWILEGLFQSQLYSIANDTLQNFMDELQTIGFIPNGGRIYYLNRSQPPLFIRMLYNYVIITKDLSILKRALPLAEKELLWWRTNRTFNVTSSYTQKKYTVYRYAVANSAPRPESYLEDYETTNGDDLPPNFYTEAQREAIWAELATGAETGWDYSSRFMKEPLLNLTNNLPSLRTLNIRAHVAVDLNAILYNAHTSMAALYLMQSKNNGAQANTHNAAANELREAILDLTWNPATLAFYDYNTTANARNTQFTTATFYPIWAGVIPEQLTNNQTAAQGFFASVNLVLSRYNGTFPTTFLETGLQWDFPNAWPPHNYIVLQALLALPKNVTTAPLPTNSNGSFALIPEGQLGLTESALPIQFINGGANVTGSGKDADINFLNGTWVNGGNATKGEGWRDALARGLANRYVGSGICSFLTSGGSVSGVLPQLPPDQRITGADDLTGLLFEKFSSFDVDSGGRGGEYTVQAGFGWTNGVLLWSSSRFGKVLVPPVCPQLHNGTDAAASPGSGSGSSTTSTAPGTTHTSGAVSITSNTLLDASLLVVSVLGGLYLAL